ncbi:hypothetical protein EV652_103532 [Kribbella steppae]|uniref:Uncharacterized protein n=1 Tax=Kribbella steppae TaxID=2512223 RepID=A0A4V2S0P9_9ACTN|nr:hypothetical protein EV652_103532 [Kribbella steppae]
MGGSGLLLLAEAGAGFSVAAVPFLSFPSVPVLTIASIAFLPVPPLPVFAVPPRPVIPVAAVRSARLRNKLTSRHLP